MKLTEALEQYEAGKKIRHKDWSKDTFMAKDGSGIESGSVRIDQFTGDEWEIVADPKPCETLAEAFEKISVLVKKHGRQGGCGTMRELGVLLGDVATLTKAKGV